MLRAVLGVLSLSLSPSRCRNQNSVFSVPSVANDEKETNVDAPFSDRRRVDAASTMGRPSTGSGQATAGR